jgi:hypothetical protein
LTARPREKAKEATWARRTEGKEVRSGMARCARCLSDSPFEERSVGLELLSRLLEARDGSHEGGSEEGRAKKHAHRVPPKRSPPENAARESATKSVDRQGYDYDYDYDWLETHFSFSRIEQPPSENAHTVEHLV